MVRARSTCPTAPGVVALRNVTHLGTRITGTLRADRAGSVLDLVAALHPTAAVGGQPSNAALAWLAAHERLDRGRYAGPVGWVDASGDGEWWVGIRCAEIDDNRARVLRAGCGIVAGSEPPRRTGREPTQAAGAAGRPRPSLDARGRNGGVRRRGASRRADPRGTLSHVDAHAGHRRCDRGEVETVRCREQLR